MNITKIIAAVIMASTGFAYSWACSGLLVGKGASADGSTIITYAADSHELYGALSYYPAADHPKGSMRIIRDWDTNKLLGEIPEAAHTYSVVGNMNEHQVSVTESTWGGRSELTDTTGIIDYGSLITIALQRSKTAREAIHVMTSLVEKYGYNSEGESFSIADPDEIWIMDMIGKGPGNKGAVWAAVRIPDDCIAAHANQARIHKIPFNDKNNCYYSKDVVTFAKKHGLYTGKDQDFSFSKTYSITDFSALRCCDARVWAYFNKFAKGMDKYLPWINGKKDAEVMPLYIKPNKKLTLKDVKSMMRNHFENTPFDMTQDIGAGPWKSPYRYRPLTFKVDSIEYTNERAIATQQTGFSLVAQMRSNIPNTIGGVLWFGVDDANTSVYIPMYCSMTTIPHSYAVGNGDLLTLSWDAAFWVNNFVANQAYNRYSLMIPDIRKVQSKIENDLENNQAQIEHQALDIYKKSPAAAAKFLNDYSCKKAQNATTEYRKLGEFLFVKYLDGNRKKEENGKFKYTKDGVPESPDFPGYDEKYYRNIVKETGDKLRVIEPEK